MSRSCYRHAMGKKKRKKGPSPSTPRPVPTNSINTGPAGRLYTGKELFLLLILFVVPFVVYLPSIEGPFLFDDRAVIVNNRDLRNPGGFPGNLISPITPENPMPERNDPSRPLTFLTYALNYAVGQLAPSGYHIVNILIHGINGILVFLLLTMLFVSITASPRKPYALIGALLFLVHPLHNTSVAYIFGRAGSLGTMFILVAILLFIIYVRTKRPVLFGSSLLSYIFALGAKQDMVVLPALIVAVDLVLNKGRIEEVKRRWAFHAGYWTVFATYIVFRAAFFGGVGNIEAESVIDRSQYLISQPYAVVRYVQLFLFPAGLSIDHNIASFHSFLNPVVMVTWSAVIVLATAAIRLVRSGDTNKSLGGLGLVWFLIALAPTSSVFPTTDILNERRMYLASTGLIISVLTAAMWLFDKRSKRLLYSIAAPTLLVFATITFHSATMFRHPEKLWNHVLKLYPEDTRAFLNYAGYLYRRGEYDKARTMYAKSLQFDPRNSSAYINIAVCHSEQANYDSAIATCERARELFPGTPEILRRLALAYKNNGRYDRAMAVLDSTIRYVKPDDSTAIAYAQSIYALFSDPAYQLSMISDSLNENPTDPLLLRRAGQLHLELKQYTRAEKYLDSSRAYDKDDPVTTSLLAQVCFQRKKYGKTEQLLKSSLRKNPDYIKTYNNLAKLYSEMKRYAEAERILRQALQTDPDNFSIQKNLGILYFITNRYEDAGKILNTLREEHPGREDIVRLLQETENQLKR